LAQALDPFLFRVVCLDPQAICTTLYKIMFWCCCSGSDKDAQVKTINNTDEYEPATGGAHEESVNLRGGDEAVPIPGDPAALKLGQAGKPGESFAVTLQRAAVADSDFGVSLFYSEAVDYLEIIDVDTSVQCVAEHNKLAANGKHVQAGQLIVGVNGASDTAGMLKEWNGSTEVNLVVCWPVEFTVFIDKVDTGMGIDVTHSQKGTSLLVEGVHTGCVQRWNDDNPDKQVKVADRIVSVNGVRGTPSDLKGALKVASGRIELVIARRP